MRRVLRFGVVGAGAAAAHLALVVAIVSAGLAPPLVANVLGFLAAFWVSYLGHRLWTFEARDLRHRTAVPRFFCVAVASFVVNEALFWLLLRYTVLPYPLALSIVLVLVAVLTYLTSRHWAFRAA